MSHEELPDEDGMVFEPEPEREASYAVAIYLAGGDEPIYRTLTASGVARDHDLAVAEDAAEVVAIALDEDETVATGRDGMGWVNTPATAHHEVPLAIELALAWFAAERLDVS